MTDNLSFLDDLQRGMYESFRKTAAAKAKFAPLVNKISEEDFVGLYEAVLDRKTALLLKYAPFVDSQTRRDAFGFDPISSDVIWSNTAHAFTGRSDRDCEICNLPDRAGVHHNEL